MMAPTPLQWDSPNVVTRNSLPKELIIERICMKRNEEKGKIFLGCQAFIQPEAQPSVTQMLTHSALYFPGNLMQRHDAVIG